mgnify:CR=1 FL=1
MLWCVQEEKIKLARENAAKLKTEKWQAEFDAMQQGMAIQGWTWSKKKSGTERKKRYVAVFAPPDEDADTKCPRLHTP